LSSTPGAERLCASAAHSCYSDRPASELMEEWDEKATWLSAPLASGHRSVIEHASYTFSVEGVSRALTHQLVRHRLASFSQMSQRYVSQSDAEYVTPDSIANDPDLKERYDGLMRRIWDDYRELLEKVPAEDARYVLPNACATNIVITVNARELLHLLELRTCRRAQDEIRAMADEMLRLARQASPGIFRDAGPPCISRGRCPEGRMSCGRPRDELRS